MFISLVATSRVKPAARQEMEPVEPKVYKEGLLFKRQRGLHQSNTKKLKFQERFIRLTSTSLDYYVPNPKKRVRGQGEELLVPRDVSFDTVKGDYTYDRRSIKFQVVWLHVDSLIIYSRER